VPQFLEICACVVSQRFFPRAGVLTLALLPVSLRGSPAWHSSHDPPLLARNQADLPLLIHPRDARITCVGQEPLQQVASLHGRWLQAPARVDRASPSLVRSELQPLPVPANEGEPASAACLFPTPYVSDAQLTQKLAGLESRLDTREPANRSACAGAPARAGEIGRTSHQHAGIPSAPIPGKTDAPSASCRGEKRICLLGTAASPTASSRPPGSVSQACADRIQRAGHLRDHCEGRRGASGARFARVV
jgi:hypothetical protein